MLAIVGTVPDPDFPLTEGEVCMDNDEIIINGRRVAVNRGTPALLAAALKAGEVLGQLRLYAYLVGDIGLGHGSRRLYEHLTATPLSPDITTFTFHYLQPDVDGHNRVLFAIQKRNPAPRLIADAGFMYAAKMSGQAPAYDLFTPDAGELAFLADEEAPHPFYTRGFILHEEDRFPDLIARAYAHDNAAKTLLVKGKQDYVADRNGVYTGIDTPVETALEAIGGTGDTLTGIVSALVDSGLEIKPAAVMAGRANRLAGHLAKPTPATQVYEIIRYIPQALAEVMAKKG